MNWRYLLPLLLLHFAASGQDDIYLTNGSKLRAKVLEIGVEQVTIFENNRERTIDKTEVLLIHYRNNSSEIINSSAKDLVLNGEDELPVSRSPETPDNLVSFNTLGLVNADFMMFYERLLRNRKIGLGCFAGYNFNPRVLPYNAYMIPLVNAKKQGDLGAFVNFYFGSLDIKRTFIWGAAVKYTPIKFTKITENSIVTGTLTTTNIVYEPGDGKQVSVLLTVGEHFPVGKQFFVRCVAGLGFFRLTGAYKDQYNYMNNKYSGSPPDYKSVLPKIFLAFNAGCFF